MCNASLFDAKGDFSSRAGMSLSLLQGYSSAEEEAEDDAGLHRNSSDDEDDVESERAVRSYSLPVATRPPGSSGLPSAFDAFSEVTSYSSRTTSFFSQFGQMMEALSCFVLFAYEILEFAEAEACHLLMRICDKI